MSKRVVSTEIVQPKDEVRLSGVLADGYGVVATRVMRDERLTIEAKAIYANLCCYASKTDHTSYPSIEKQCSDLGIGENRYLKHRKLLVKYGYITITQRRERVKYDDGTAKERATHNLYTIVMSEPVEVDGAKTKEKKIESKEVKSLHLQNGGPQNTCIQDRGTNNININNTNINNNIKDIYTPASKEKKKKDTPVKHTHGEYKHVRLTDEELNKLIAKHGEIKTKQAITKLDEYMEMTGKSYKSCYLAMLKWVFTAVDQDNKPKQQQKSSNKFNNFSQRNYTGEDYRRMEQELLDKDNAARAANVHDTVHGNVLDLV